MAEEALELTQRLDESVLSAWAAMAVARASVMAGRSQRAVDVLGRPRRRLLPAIPGAWRAMGLEALATAYADLGRSDDAAARSAAAAEAHAAALGPPDGDRLGAARRRGGRPARRRSAPRRRAGAGVRAPRPSRSAP